MWSVEKQFSETALINSFLSFRKMNVELYCKKIGIKLDLIRYEKMHLDLVNKLILCYAPFIYFPIAMNRFIGKSRMVNGS